MNGNFKKLLAVLTSAAVIQGMLPSAVLAGEETGIISVMEDQNELSGEIILETEQGSVSDVSENAEDFIVDADSPAENSDKDFSSGILEEADGLQDEPAEESSEAQNELSGSPEIQIEEIIQENDPGLEPETETPEMFSVPVSWMPTAGEYDNSSEVSDNRNEQNYGNWSSPVYSYLIEDGSDYLRIECFSDGVLVERYDSTLLRQDQKLIPRELSIFGGFYSGSDAYYLAFGQTNKEEDNSKEVVRIVKYDKDWNRLGQASLRGANTVIPFDAGSLRMAEYGGYLYIRTSHEMYTSSDGLNHQANLMIQVRTSDMMITDSYSAVMNSSVGYVSHSFNQFILVDDAGNLVALDHGDAYPRSFLLGTYRKKAGESTFQSGYSGISFLKFPGETGDNYTGATIGGLEYSSTSYLTAGNTVLQDSNWKSNSERNIFVAAFSRNGFPYGEVYLKQITDYTQGSGISASTPHLVKLSSDSFLLLWAETENRRLNGKLCYLFLDENALPVSDIYTAEGYLSDCKPLVSGDKAIWYVTDGEKLTFYQVNLTDRTFQSEVGHMHAYEPSMEFEKTTAEYGLVEETAVNRLTTDTDGVITYTSSDPDIATVDSEGTVSLKGLGTCTITANAAAGIDYRAKSLSYTLNVLDLLKQVIQVPETISCTYGDKSFPIEASCLGGVTPVYSVEDPEIASVSEDGIITAGHTGTTTITLRTERTEQYTGASAVISLTVEPKDIDSCQMVFSKIGPVSVSDFEDYMIVLDGDKILKEDEDFEFWGASWHYSGSSLISVDRYIEGIGNYTGSADKTASPISTNPTLSSLSLKETGAVLKWEQESGAAGYEIYRKLGEGNYQSVQTITDNSVTTWTDSETDLTTDSVSYYIKAYTRNSSGILYSEASNVKSVSPSIDLSNCQISLPSSSYTYNGREWTPSAAVSCNGQTLKLNKDYTVSYKNNINAGKASVVITGKGGYSGSSTVSFKIQKAPQSLIISPSSLYLKKGKSANVTVLNPVGKVTYSSKNSSIAKVNKKGTVKGKSVGKTVITVKAAGNENYKAASKKITVTVKKK